MRKFFKNKEKRKQFFILFFTVLISMVFILEIVTFPLMYREPKTETKTEEELIKKFSKQWIFDEKLTEQEEEFLIQRGLTIMSYYYLDNNSFELESIVKSLNGQVILEKIKSNETKLELKSLRNSISLENLSEIRIFEGLCETLNYPPPDCSSFEE